MVAVRDTDPFQYQVDVYVGGCVLEEDGDVAGNCQCSAVGRGKICHGKTQ